MNHSSIHAQSFWVNCERSLRAHVEKFLHFLLKQFCALQFLKFFIKKPAVNKNKIGTLLIIYSYTNFPINGGFKHGSCSTCANCLYQKTRLCRNKYESYDHHCFCEILFRLWGFTKNNLVTVQQIVFPREADKHFLPIIAKLCKAKSKGGII